MAWDDCNNTDAGDLTISAVPMNCAAWRVENLWTLWLPAKQRGQDSIRHGTNGRKPRKRRRDATVRSLYVRINGWSNHLGVPFTNPYQGLYTNIRYLGANVVDPPGTLGNGTRPAVLTTPFGTTLSEPVTVIGMEVEEMKWNATECVAVIEVSIPSGWIS